MRSRRLDALLVLASIGVALVAGEVYYRVRHARTVTTILDGRDPETLVTRAVDDGRIYALRPDTPLTNAHGFRDVERSREKPDGVYRIAVIGDSVTMAGALPIEKGYVRRLEQELTRLRPGESIEALNFGVDGYSTAQELALLEAEVFGFDPDAILWQFHDNDAIRPTLANADGGLVTYYSRSWSRLYESVSRRVIAHQRKRFARDRKLGDLSRELVDQLYAWEQTTALWERVRAAGDARGVPVYVFLYPSWPDGDDWRAYGEEGFEVHRKLARRFERLGFTTLDLLPLLSRHDPTRFRHAPDDPWHPNERGHRWLADTLAGWLDRRLPRPLVRPPAVGQRGHGIPATHKPKGGPAPKGREPSFPPADGS